MGDDTISLCIMGTVRSPVPARPRRMLRRSSSHCSRLSVRGVPMYVVNLRTHLFAKLGRQAVEKVVEHAGMDIARVVMVEC